MTDDANDNQPQPSRRRPAPGEASSPAGADRDRDASTSSASHAAADNADPLAALEKLQALTSVTAAPPVADGPTAAPQPRRLASLASRTSRLRPAAAPRTGHTIARIAAPAVFLVAVVVLLSIIVQSGIIGGKAEPAVTPTPAATKTKSGGNATHSRYKLYVVKSGDTLSGIAVKFGITTSDIEVLNPKISSSTLVVGTKIKVPKPAP